MASGTTHFDNTVAADALVAYTSGGAVALPALSTVASLTATTLNAETNSGTVAHALPGTTLTAAGTFAPAAAGGYIVMNAAAGTNLAWTLTTTNLRDGAVYHVINVTAPTSGTYTLTASAGTFYNGGALGTVARFAGGNYALSFLVLSNTRFQVLANVGTVSFA